MNNDTTFEKYIDAYKDANTSPLTVEDIEVVMNKIIDARVEQKLAEQKTTPQINALDDKKGS